MADRDEATENPNDKMPPGKPLAPEAAQPNDSAPAKDDDVDETSAGGLRFPKDA